MKKLLSKALMAGALVGGLTFATVQPAQAEWLDFTVDEGAVDGALDVELIVDKLNGGYTEIIEFFPAAVPGNPCSSADTSGCITFETSAYANFAQYYANEGSTAPVLPGTDPEEFQDAQLNCPFDECYKLYALFTAEGHVEGGVLVGDTAIIDLYVDDGSDTVFTTDSFSVAGATPTPDSNLTPDDLVLSTSNFLLGSGSFTGLNHGEFKLIFGTAPGDLTDPFGLAYWPGLANLVLVMTVDGDFDLVPNFTGIHLITGGDVSAVFEAPAAVPEPATLGLFGLGLAGVAVVARRRRKNVA